MSRPWPKSGFSKPSRVLGLYTGELREEEAAVCVQDSIAFTREAFDFGRQLAADETRGFRLDISKNDWRAWRQRSILVTTIRPSYVFRWGSTHVY